MAKRTKSTQEMLETLINLYGMDRMQIATKAGTSPWSVTRWLTGDVKKPLKVYAKAIEKLYDREVAKRSQDQ